LWAKTESSSRTTEKMLFVQKPILFLTLVYISPEDQIHPNQHQRLREGNKTSCQWRMIPPSFGHRNTFYYRRYGSGRVSVSRRFMVGKGDRLQ
ncbi:hypothetical protein, partial [Candidatus Entotheonella palauensis]|uniref:hypothetical protein n=1 Tax=Candidatus Entotheonella palauensis TaxID=93172 RepID=UPI001C4E0DAD